MNEPLDQYRAYIGLSNISGNCYLIYHGTEPDIIHLATAFIRQYANDSFQDPDAVVRMIEEQLKPLPSDIDLCKATSKIIAKSTKGKKITRGR